MNNETKHTPEPWHVISIGDYEHYGSPAAEIHDAYGRTATVYGDDGQDEANARRIVACVNACAGIPTDHLDEVMKATRAHWGQA